MKTSDLEKIAKVAIMLHSAGPIVYVGSGVSDDIKPDEKRFVVMVNEQGDRIAYKPPGGGWGIDTVKIIGQYQSLPNSQHAIRIDTTPLEND